TEPSCKIDALLELIEELGGAQATVFAESKQLIDLAAKRLDKQKVTYTLLTGDVPESKRNDNVKRFQAGDVQLFLATLGAGSESITLNAAAVSIFLQRSWSLVKNLQGEDRVQGIGQAADHVEVIDVVARNTLEEARLRVIGQKEARLHEITRDPKMLYRLLSYDGGEM
ncbi:MAG: C-terminal helicase domain-containing protein, partial [Vicinamibacterales bacterium]